jgi:hypothetical protein
MHFRFVDAVLLTALIGVTVAGNPVRANPPDARATNLFAQFDVPDDWQARFWADPAVKGLLTLEAKDLAALVPLQSGVRFCRCPACDAAEAEDPLGWSIAKPDVLTCRHCGVTVPNDTYPAKDEKDKKVPEETVEVLPRLTHHYPYHVVEPAKQRYPDERLYLAAKRDYEARQFLAKAALYAALRYHNAGPTAKDPALARMASVLILRFAQVYPAYATHYDRLGSPKLFQQADLPPPYRRGYQTGKWEWTASLDVPLNLVIAYALVRDDPAIAEAGRLLGDPHPTRTIEHDLFRASAEFVRLQPEEYSEMSLQAYRGLLAVGRLLNDPALIHEVLARLNGFAERGFYHDGLWRQGDAAAHRRILQMIDGWLDRLLAGYADPPGFIETPGDRRLDSVRRIAEVPMLLLARSAGSAMLSELPAPEIQQAAWPSVVPAAIPRHPALLGGAGLARLAVGKNAGAIDLGLRGQDSLGAPHFQRQAIRLTIAGRPVLGDLDDLPATRSGWDRATASHNTVIVDGLNQRESLLTASEPAPGGNFVYFGAEPDFQAVSLDDPRAYPQSTTRYRQTLVAASGARISYAIGVFEVHGGLQHDQLFHASAGSTAAWAVALPMGPGPASLLSPAIPYVRTARAEERRWFVQAYGEFAPLQQGRLVKPATAWLASAEGPGVRLHLLGDAPATVYTATSPDPSVGETRTTGDRSGRGALIVRRRSQDGATLKSTFVTVFEPTGAAAVPLTRVGRVAARDGVVVIYLETPEGAEHVVINLDPGNVQDAPLAGGQRLRTDGLAVRLTGRSLVLAGGSFAETAGRRVEQQPARGTITGAFRRLSTGSRGWFETDEPLPEPASLAGRILLITHGDGTTRGWTLVRVENIEGGARLHVREEPGFELESSRGRAAHYYQFPRVVAPAPHRYRISRTIRLGAPAGG